MIHEIDLDGARELVRDMPFRDLGPEDIVEIRHTLGLNQVAFADFLGVADNTVYRWETSRNDVPTTISLAVTALCFMRIAYDAEINRQDPLQLRRSSSYVDKEREREIFGNPRDGKGTEEAPTEIDVYEEV